MRRPVSAGAHRRLARVKRAMESIGLRRLPGYDRLALGLRGVVFPALDDGSELVPVKLGDLLLEVPARYLPHYLHRAYEPLTSSAFRAALQPGALAVDVGAHIGYYTCLAARAAGPGGSVQSFEPSSENVSVIRHNLHRNGLTNAVVHEVAATASAGSRVLHLTEATDNHSLHGHPASPTVATTNVAGVPVDDVVDGPARVIKVDVEGAEQEVLAGMRGLLGRSHGATVLVEWNPEALRWAGTPPDTLPDLMLELGVKDLTVLDEHAAKVRDLDEVRSAVEAGTTPHGWYGTLCGRVP